MEMPRSAPPVIKGYEVLAPLAQGGMAEVWLAQRTGSAELVVLKRLLPRFAQNRHTRERILREAQIGAILSHPNVALTLDAGVVGEEVYIAAEYVAGKDLESLSHTLARNQQPFPAGLVARIFSEVLEGLHAAHEAKDSEGRVVGLVHRDLSPRNVLLGFDGQVKIIDFGLARANLGTYRTEPGSVLGTYRYMSPEQAIGEPVDRRSDIFSIGTSMYELFTGTWLFDAPEKTEILKQIVTARLPPPTERNPNLPAALDQVIQVAMAHTPADRFPTAKALRSALAAAAPHWSRTPLDSLGLLLRQVFPHDADRAREQLMLAQHRGPPPGEVYARATMDQTSMADTPMGSVPGASVTEVVRLRRPRVHQRLSTIIVRDREGAVPAAGDMAYLPSGGGQPTSLEPVEDDVRAAVRPHCDLFGMVGLGGMSRIYVGHEHGTTNLRAVKLFAPQPGASFDLTRERFRREAEMLRRANHPTIPTFVALDDAKPELTFMVMELVDGINLEELRWSQGGRIAPELLLPLMLDFLDGLAHMHELKGDDGESLGFAHRDISPDNMMVSFSGQPKLIDFGIAKLARHQLTQVGVFLGKPEFADPRQPGDRANALSDIYAVAVVMFEMLAGQRYVRAQPGESVSMILQKAAQENMDERLQAEAIHVPTELRAVIARAGAYEPRDRFPNAHSFRKVLEAACTQIPLATRDEIATAVQKAEGQRKETFELLREGVEEHESSVYVTAPGETARPTLQTAKTVRRPSRPVLSVPLLVLASVGALLVLGVGIGLGLGLAQRGSTPEVATLAPVAPSVPVVAAAPPAPETRDAGASAESKRPLRASRPSSPPLRDTAGPETTATLVARAPEARSEPPRRAAPTAAAAASLLSKTGEATTSRTEPVPRSPPISSDPCRGAQDSALDRLETLADKVPPGDRACFQDMLTVVSSADRWLSRCRRCAAELTKAAASAQN